MYKRYQPTKDSYDMIYGGFQSMGVPLNHPFQLGIFHENNHPASLGYPHGTPRYEQLLGISRTIVGSIGSSKLVPCTLVSRIRAMTWKSHGFHNHNSDLMFSLPWAYRGNFCVFLAIDKLREGSRNCVGSGGCLQELLDMFEE